MEKITYAQYLQENIGSLGMSECLDVIGRAERGELSDLAVEEELTPVVGNILSELFNNDRETFEYLLSKIKTTAEQIAEQENHIDFILYPVGDAVDLVAQFNTVLERMREGRALRDHWIDQDGGLVIVLSKPQE